ncbi:cytochrome P450 4C1-like isoform X2 [Periplaneta americana]|uniref:cytochrome P450 4C1-like isoform X2 n=1 Tax=Periplaneta americana TaxID=6978 RepID=UPI0037E90C1F
MLTFLLCLFVAGFIAILVYFHIKMRQMAHLPGPTPLPLLGNIFEIGLRPNSETIYKLMIRLYYDYGPVYRLWLGPELCINVSDAEYAKALLSSHVELDKAWSYKYVNSWLGTGLLTGTGPKWKAHRKLINPTFHVEILEQFVEVFNSNADILIEKLASQVDGPEFDIFPYITRCSLDIICETAMGVSVLAQQDSNSQYEKTIRNLCDSIMTRSAKPWLHPDFLFNLSSEGKLQQQWLDIIHNKTRSVIQARRKHLNEKKEPAPASDSDLGRKKCMAFLDMLIQSPGNALTDEDIQQEVDTFMFAGHDTTSSSLGFTCWLLANHPHVQDAVVMEQREIFGSSDRHATFHELQQMKYLEQVIKESLRLYPSVSLYGRKLTHDLHAVDYLLPAGCNVFIMSYLLHRDPKYFPDPEKFDLDRFLPENILNRHPYSYLPFSTGPRNCIDAAVTSRMHALVQNCFTLRQGAVSAFLPVSVLLVMSVSKNMK